MQHDDPKLIDVYVELLDEGTDTWRPTTALDAGGGLYQLLPTAQYDPEDEAWAFLPGALVRLEETRFVDGTAGLLVRHPDPQAVRIEVPQEEGDVFALRGTQALHLGDGTYKILATPHYDPADQHWKFPPGSLVRLEMRTSADGLFPYLTPVERIA